ncbi:MAG: BMP family ABC transporter substrate-binding protein, partial [Clostridia bacterium]|nr:BMP family ABC transporter substrate-binding protein [Clostridia bacterium]
VITSAMKGLAEATEWAITKMYNDEWADIGGIATSLGVENDAVGLPTAAESWGFETYTVEQYQDAMAAVKAGEITIDGETITEAAIAEVEFSNLKIDYI